MTDTRRYLFFVILAVHAGLGHADSTVIDAWCDYLGGRLRSVTAADCRTQGFVASSQATPQGNALVYRDIEAAKTGPEAQAARRILVIGGIHGDELTSISIVFRWLELIQQPEEANYRWRVIPLANPDGLKAQPSTRVNGRKVDLNRNFQTPDWDKDAETYWVKRTGRDPRRFPGKAAGSEVETLWLQAQIDEYKPDLIISVHAPYNLLDYDGPVPKPMRFGRLILNQLGVYPGSLGNYAGLHKQIPVITIELPNATSMPSQREQLDMWSDMQTWIKDNFKDATNQH